MKLINIIFVFFVVFISGCHLFDKEIIISGTTMGTTYHIKIVALFYKLDKVAIKKKVDILLKKINHSMSIFDKKSEISRFNNLSSDKRFKVSKDFMNVFLEGRKIYSITNGAWDGTVCNLVNLWGFGSKANGLEILGEKELEPVLSYTGYELVNYDYNQSEIWKKKDKVSLDFGSIAKGYAVDRVALLLKSLGFKNFMVEIGGEIFTSGFNKNKEKWVIGINRPIKNADINDVFRLLNISGKAVATSGSYRNYIDKGGRSFSHIIDPRTGSPVKNKVVSVSVISNSCVLSDGLATGLMVMGAKRGISLCNSLDDVDCMIVEKGGDNFKIFDSIGFGKYLLDIQKD